MKVNINGKEVDIKGLSWIRTLIGLGVVGIVLLVIGVLVFVLIFPVLLAILGIWALNTLFHLGIAYTFIDIAAGVILIWIFGGVKISFG